MASRIATAVLRQVAARAALQLRVLANLTCGEPELKLLPGLCDRGGASIDIGSCFGVYAAVMSLHSARTYAFEPNPHLFRILQHALDGAVAVGPFALSDRVGVTELRIPVFAGKPFFGRATVEQGNRLSVRAPIESIKVETRPLDSLSLGKVGLIKIDVEGHEAAVLRGARETLIRDRPSLIVESEERHSRGCPEAIFDFLTPLGYHGFFLLKGQLRPIATFDKSRHQDLRHVGRYGKTPGAAYVNNFIFVHGPKGKRRLEALVPPDTAP